MLYVFLPSHPAAAGIAAASLGVLMLSALLVLALVPGPAPASRRA